jgi:hypothetical protein
MPMLRRDFVNGYNKYTRDARSVSYATRAQKRIAWAAIILLLISLITMSILHARSAGYRSAAEQQFRKRLNSSLIDAIEQVNRLTGGVQSNSSTRLALVRQYVYGIDQINDISIAIQGEKGRLVPAEAIEALYLDIETYERLIQTATSSTLDIRTQLLTHLTALQEQIRTSVQ